MKPKVDKSVSVPSWFGIILVALLAGFTLANVGCADNDDKIDNTATAPANPSNAPAPASGPMPANTQSLKRVPGNSDYSVDTVANMSQPKGPVTIDSTTMPEVIIAGWAVDTGARTEAGGVFINVDGKTDIPGTYGTERPDVAVVNKNPRYKQSGFAAVVPVSLMGKGQHILSLRILTGDRKGYYEPAEKIVLNVQ